MGGGVLNSIARYLTRLDETQRELKELFARKRTSLRLGRTNDLLQLADEESVLVEQLQQRLQEREELLTDARANGATADSIKSLIAECEDTAPSELLARAEHLEQTAAELRRESWVQWIIAQRSFKQYAHLLDRIAHRGRSAPTYDKREKTTGGAGALLDASA